MRRNASPQINTLELVRKDRRVFRVRLIHNGERHREVVKIPLLVGLYMQAKTNVLPGAEAKQFTAALVKEVERQLS